MTHGMKHEHRRRRAPDGHGRHRARRGAVGAAILGLLDEQPMHGYELITALEERSGGRWKPSAGSVYPALRRLEFHGLITSTEDDGKRRFALTPTGRERLAEQQKAGHETPWDDHGLGSHGELRRAIAELTGPARQIGRFGTPEQMTTAVEAVKATTASLYRLLADGATSTPAKAEAASEPTAKAAAKPTAKAAAKPTAKAAAKPTPKAAGKPTAEPTGDIS